MNQGSYRSGFTLVELMLAMGFVSVLLLAIVMTVLQIGNIYNRGITFKNVNQTGAAIASELQRSINKSEPFSIVDPGSRFIVTKSGGSVIGGRLCTGQYTFIWNYGRSLSPTLNAARNIYSSPTVNNSANAIRFAKSFDPSYRYCTLLASGSYPDIDLSESIEMLKAGQSDLAIHNFSITSSDSVGTSSQRMYSIEFEIGTNDQQAIEFNSSLGDWVCRPPDVFTSNINFCSISRFNVAARAGNLLR